MRATSVTQMYETGVPEVIQEQGHRSLEALCVYKRTNSQQHQMVSSVLSAPRAHTYVEQMQNNTTQQHSSCSVMTKSQHATGRV